MARGGARVGAGRKTKSGRRAARCRLRGWGIRTELATGVSSQPVIHVVLPELYANAAQAMEALALKRPSLQRGHTAIVIAVEGELREGVSDRA